MFLVFAARGTRRAWFSQVVITSVERGSLRVVVYKFFEFLDREKEKGGERERMDRKKDSLRILS